MNATIIFQTALMDKMFDNQDYDLQKVVEAEIETIDSERGIEIEQLLEKASINREKFCKFFKICKIFI